MESIAGVFFGDYATPDFVGNIKRYLPAISFGLFSFPVRFPWPLNQIPVFGFGRSMDAREAFKSDVLGVLDERRADLDSAKEGGSSGKSAGLLDSLIRIQQNQLETEGGNDERFDDDFVFDNVRTYRINTACCFDRCFALAGHEHRVLG